MSRMDNEQFRQALENEEHRIEAMVADVRSDDELDTPEQEAAGGELSEVDQHPADAGTETAAREVNLSLLEQLEAELTDIERALAKLDDGTYGTCEACGKPIGEERLAAKPAARFCLEDQARAEQVVNLRPNMGAQDIDNSANTPL
jgi:RNA polymerase-binding transcription factor DksA